MTAASIDASPVLVVGAGPTGLAAAMSLARAHVPVRVIDKALHPDPHTRAIGIQARTLELFEQHRLVEPFLDLGHRARAANLYSNGQRLAQLDFDPLLTRYPYLLFLDQSVTERLMTAHLATFGVDVERGVELTAFAHDADGVHATLRRADGAIETFDAAYLVAADGAHSTVRHALGMRFAGKTFAQTFLLADVHADTGWPEDELHIFASADGLAALFPLGDGRHRLIADRSPLRDSETAHAGDAGRDAAQDVATNSTPDDAAGLAHESTENAEQPASPPSLEDCRNLVAQRIRHSVDLSDLAWSAYFHVNSRMVEQLRSGRVFLAGDAAHVHSPAGAQGMNTGIQEAFNLGWKLARCLKGGAPDRLLDTYHAERHPIERGVLRQTSFVTQMAQADHGPLKLLRERVMPALAALGPLRDAARRQVSELAVQYRRSPLTLERVLNGGPRAGARAPDARVHVVDGPLGRAPGVGCVFDLHDPAYFSLFVLVASDAADDAPPLAGMSPVSAGTLSNEIAPPVDLDGFAAEIERVLPGAVRVWRVTDIEGEGALSLAEAYGRTRPSFYLVRPDGYIAARGRPSTDLLALVRHCEAWFAPGGEPRTAER